MTGFACDKYLLTSLGYNALSRSAGFLALQAQILAVRPG